MSTGIAPAALVASIAMSAPCDPIVFESEPGTYCVPERTEYVDTYCWAQNETSTGVQAPVYRIDGSREQGALIAIDATSAAGAIPVDISQTDRSVRPTRTRCPRNACSGRPTTPCRRFR